MRTPLSSSLHAAGLRVTPQRQAILQVLDDSDRPLNVEEILSRMAGYRSGIPTVYRNLQQFAAQGWVEPIVGPDQVMRFVRCQSPGHHHHVQCEKCGRMVEVEGCAIKQVLESLEAQSGFRITRHQLQLFGLCPRCREA
ncbi:MAG TPA: Fur family transcriptional regulator [Holophaga sp.]|nr:Fur family transcriptional regulator [Holophaga sp.]HPS67195.1 Fur family transcriptional regulator [Holophaga sp.]